MGYAERVPSPKGAYWRGRYKDPSGKYVSVRDEHSRVARFTGKREAEKAANDAEADVRNRRWRDPGAGSILFSEWADHWYSGLDLAESTMANRKRHLENHLIPFFGAMPMRDIEEGGPALIARWEAKEKARYAPLSVKSWRGTLHVCLEDAKGRHITANPAELKPGRGKRSGRSVTGLGGSEKVITNTLGILLAAERMAILTGRDDEFVMVVTNYFAATRLGELTGLEKKYVRPENLRVEWQLSEVEGRLHRVPPKDDSRGDVVLPAFLRRLLADHMRRKPPEPCPCHGQPYVFRGCGVPKARWNRPLRELAVLSGISEHTVRQALNGTRPVSDAMRQRVLEAAERFGFERPESADGPAWHWRHSSFEGMFTAAASGWFPPRGGQKKRPVHLEGEWPGTRVLGPRPESRAQFCWGPIAVGLTPHSERHSAKTMMEGRRIPEIMSEAQMRHRVGGVSGIYRHTTPEMRAELADVMTQEWTTALDARLDMSLALGTAEALSPVAVLDRLLRERLASRKLAVLPSDSPELAGNVTRLPVRTNADLRIRENG